MTYQYRNTGDNGGCEDGRVCLAYGIAVSARSDVAEAVTDLIAMMGRQGWACGQVESSRQAGMYSPDRRRFVVLEPVADLLHEPADVQADFVPEELTAARGQADPRSALAIFIHRQTTAYPDLRAPEAVAGLCSAKRG